MLSRFSLMGGLQKCQYGSENIVLQGHHILSTTGDALRGGWNGGWLAYELHCCWWLEGGNKQAIGGQKK